MRRFFPVLLMGLSLLGPSQARAELDDYNLGILTRKAWGCGNALQAIRGLHIEEHYPDFEANFLKLAKARGPSEWQLKILEIVFEAGIENAVQEGIVQGYQIDKDVQAHYKREFDKRISRCSGI